MARKLRVQYPGAIYHVLNRGDRRAPIFRDDEDRQRLLPTLGEACAKTGWQVPAYRPWKKAAFSEYPKGGHQGTAMRTDRYRYVEWRDKQGEVAARELYDHQADPAENQNLAGRTEHASLVGELTQQMRAGWRAAVP